MAEEPQDPNKKQKPLTYAGNKKKNFETVWVYIKTFLL